MASRHKVFFDGGCRPNPGTMEIAVVAAGQTIVLPDLGQGTSTDAEWLALIHALRVARAMGLEDLVLLGDAAHVVGPASGAIPARGVGAVHCATFRALVAEGPAPHLRRIKRTQNLAGIALARRHPR